MMPLAAAVAATDVAEVVIAGVDARAGAGWLVRLILMQVSGAPPALTTPAFDEVSLTELHILVPFLRLLLALTSISSM
jgi:hypothetical protein